MDKRPTGIRCKGEPSKGRINLRLETIGQKTGEREGVKQTTARRARRSEHADELQHGIRLQHCARRCAHSGELQHGAVRYSTPATHMPQHGTHSAVRTPRSHNTAQCPGDTCSTARTARMAQGAHRGATVRLGAHHRQKANARARQRAQQSTKQLGRGRNTQGPGAHRAHQHEHSALGAGQ